MNTAASQVANPPLNFGIDEFARDCLQGKLGQTLQYLAVNAFPINLPDVPIFKAESTDRASLNMLRFLRAKADF